VDEAPQPAPQATRGKLARFGIRIALAILVTVAFGRVLQFSVNVSQREGRLAGFGTGVAHGALMPCGFPMLLVGRDIPIYAERNTGRPYNLGYTLGVNLCGAFFFGSVYWRLSRLRRFARELRQPAKEAQSVS
jgi:hypothetical protein